MSEPLRQLADLSEAAILHAADVHGLQLGPGGLRQVDAILDRERATGDPGHVEALALCYGAWLGQLAVSRCAANWTGLSEPAAPRILVNGITYSPIDAVRRRLESGRAPTVCQLMAQLESNLPAAGAGREFLEHNRAAWDARVSDPRFAYGGELPPDRSAAQAALDPWLQSADLVGARVLCLAAGGGTHAPLLALAGATVTVVDFSRELLQLDDRIAKKHGLDVTTLQASMDDLSGLDSALFDCVVQPVSACYVPDVLKVYAEVARVLRPGGLYIVQHKQPASLQAGAASADGGYLIAEPSGEGRPLPAPAADILPQRESGVIEFVHSLDALLGGLCRSGFQIEDVQEPPRADAWAPLGSAEHRALFLPPYLKIKSRRLGS